jgi:hypothetical protein
VGVAHGLVSIVSEPIKGARAGGVAGFTLGVGKGLVGAAIRPAAGVLQLIDELHAVATEEAAGVAELWGRDSLLCHVWAAYFRRIADAINRSNYIAAIIVKEACSLLTNHTKVDLDITFIELFHRSNCCFKYIDV